MKVLLLILLAWLLLSVPASLLIGYVLHRLLGEPSDPGNPGA